MHFFFVVWIQLLQFYRYFNFIHTYLFYYFLNWHNLWSLQSWVVFSENKMNRNSNKILSFYLVLVLQLSFVKSFDNFQFSNNGSSCDNLNVFSKHDGKRFRGLEFVSDDRKWLQSKREPRLFSFSTEEQVWESSCIT